MSNPQPVRDLFDLPESIHRIRSVGSAKADAVVSGPTGSWAISL
jgi:hypothetical protein